jgi:predicted GIY-YIG superfamily endonuclease
MSTNRSSFPALRAGITLRLRSGQALTWLVYHAETNDIREAIAREKQIKAWSRAKKVALIEEMNPEWDDLAASWCSNAGHRANPD